MAQDKQIKFQFVVDDASVQKLRASLREILADFNKVIEAGHKAGGALGGGGGQSLITGLSGKSGGTQESTRAIARAPVAARGLVQSFMDHKNMFKGMAEGSKDSLRVMSSALRTAVGEQVRDIEKLQRAIGALEKSYDKVGAGNQGAVASKIIELRSKVQSKQEVHDQLVSQGRNARLLPPPLPRRELMPEIPWPGQGDGAISGLAAKIPWYRRRFMDGSSPMFQQGGMMGPGSLAGGMMNRMGVNPANVGRMGLAAVGVQGLRQIANEVQVAPQRFSQYGAFRGNMVAPEIQALWGGDSRNPLAMNSILRDRDKRKDFDDLNGGARRFGMNAWEMIKSVGTLDFHRAGMVATGRYADDRVTQDRQAMVQQERQADPLREIVLGELQDNWRGNIGGMRSLGVGEGFDKKTGQYKAGYRNLVKSLTAAGYDPGQAAAVLGGIESGGTRGAAWGKGGLMFSALSAQSGGLHGAAQMGGTMSRFGGGAGMNFLNAARVMGGSQTDVAVANSLGSFVAQQAGAHNVGGLTGLGSLGMLGFGVGKGPESRMIAQQNMAGYGTLQNIIGGGTDSYQGARNLQIAMGSARGAGVYTQDYLAEKLNLGQMADIMSGSGGLSPIMKSLGVTKDMVGSQFKGVTQSTLERMISDPAMANTGMAKTMSSIQESGLDPRAWLKKQKGKKGFKTEEAVSDYGAFLLMSGQAKDEESAMGAARNIFGMGRKASGKGKKVSDVAGGSLDMSKAKEEAEKLGVTISTMVAEAEKFKAAIEIQGEGAKALGSLAQNVGASGEAIADSLKAVALAIDMALDPKNKGKTSKELIEMGHASINRERAEAQKKAAAAAARRSGIGADGRPTNRGPKY